MDDPASLPPPPGWNPSRRLKVLLGAICAAALLGSIAMLSLVGPPSTPISTHSAAGPSASNPSVREACDQAPCLLVEASVNATFVGQGCPDLAMLILWGDSSHEGFKQLARMPVPFQEGGVGIGHGPHDCVGVAGGTFSIHVPHVVVLSILDPETGRELSCGPTAPPGPYDAPEMRLNCIALTPGDPNADRSRSGVNLNAVHGFAVTPWCFTCRAGIPSGVPRRRTLPRQIPEPLREDLIRYLLATSANRAQIIGELSERNPA